MHKMSNWNLFIHHTSYIRSSVSFMPTWHIFGDTWFSSVYAMPCGIYVCRNEWNNKVRVQPMHKGYVFIIGRCVSLFAMRGGNLFRFSSSSFM